MKNKILNTARTVALKVFNVARRHRIAAILIVALVIAFLVEPWLALVVIATVAALAWYGYRGQIRHFFKEL